MKQIRLQESSYDKKEINEVIDSLESTFVVMGNKCRLFEEKWKQWQNCNYVTFVNSGSSANLLIINLLKSLRGKYQLKAGDEILVPAVTWSTTLFPIIQLGLKPVIVDVDPCTFNISMESCIRKISKNTKAIFVVHLLGNPVNMDKMTKFAQLNNLVLIEDCCEAVGAKWNGENVGNFGVASSVSFMFAHHMTTIEGGMVHVKDSNDDRIIKCSRAHGWIREFSSEQKQDILEQYKPEDEKFFFWDLGFNLRPTEINASFGIHQIDKLDNFILIRRRNFDLYKKMLMKISHLIQMQESEDDKKSYQSNYAFGLYIKDLKYSRKDLMNYLLLKGIESRVLVAGNLAKTPVYETYFGKANTQDLKVSEVMHEKGLYLPNHQALTEEDVIYICDNILNFFNK